MNNIEERVVFSDKEDTYTTTNIGFIKKIDQRNKLKQQMSVYSSILLLLSPITVVLLLTAIAINSIACWISFAVVLFIIVIIGIRLGTISHRVDCLNCYEAYINTEEFETQYEEFKKLHENEKIVEENAKIKTFIRSLKSIQKIMKDGRSSRKVLKDSDNRYAILKLIDLVEKGELGIEVENETNN